MINHHAILQFAVNVISVFRGSTGLALTGNPFPDKSGRGEAAAQFICRFPSLRSRRNFGARSELGTTSRRDIRFYLAGRLQAVSTRNENLARMWLAISVQTNLLTFHRGNHWLLLRGSAIVAMLLAWTFANASPGAVEIWIRAFIPDPSHAGKAAGFIVDLPNEASQSVVRLLPSSALNQDCFATDHRSFSSNSKATSRLETRFVLRAKDAVSAFVEPLNARTVAASTTKVDCITARTLDQKPGRVDRDNIGKPAVADGLVQVIGQAQGTNVIPIAGHGPSIDYSFDIKWTPLAGRLSVSLTYGSFPATEVYARTENGSWVPVLQRLPSGSPWNLTLDGLGLGTSTETQTVELAPLDGKWQSTDPDGRFSLEFKGNSAIWIERNATNGATLRREVPIERNASGSIRVSRANDAEVLAFLGFQPALGAEIIARNPNPSYLLITLAEGGLRADWNGLIVTKDNSAHLKELIQPGVRPAKLFDLRGQ